MDPLPFVIAKATLLLCAGLITVGLLNRANPRWRIFVCQLTGIALLALPLVAVGPFAIPLPIRSESVPAPVLPAAPFENAYTGAVSPAEADGSPESFGPDTSTAAVTAKARTGWSGQPSPAAMLWLAYAAGIAVLLVRYLLWRLRIRRAISGYVEPDDVTRARFDSIVREFDFPMLPRLRIAPAGTSPFCCGLRGGSVIVPDSLKAAAQAEALGFVLRHELHHLANRDLRRSAFLTAVAALLWFHPLAWMLRRCHSTAIEELGDRVAAGAAGADGRERYRSTLARLALDLRHARCQAPVALGLFRTPQIMVRLRRLRSEVSHRPLGIAARAAFALTIACPALLAVSALQVTAESKPDATALEAAAKRPSLIDLLPAAERQAATESAGRGLKFVLAQEQEGGGFQNSTSSKIDDYGTATTSLAGLAFLAHGGAADDSAYHAAIVRSIDKVLSAQDRESGMFLNSLSPPEDEDAAPTKKFGNLYVQAIAATFLAKALPVASPERQANIRWSLTRILDVLVKAQAVDKAEAARGGWRYTPVSRDSDLSCTCWVVRALYAINEAGIDVAEEVFAQALAYIGRSQTEAGGFTYSDRAGNANAALTAAALFCLQKAGKGDTEAAAKAAEQLPAMLGEAAKAYEFYRFLWAAAAMSERGGEEAEAVAEILVKHCSSRQETDGSWKASHGDILGTVFVLMAYGSGGG
jgi:beta-lactamase regulating signal transducer with metallopeptidase domain